MTEEIISIARRCLRYEPDTGKIFWVERPSPTATKSVIGSEAGCLCGQGYRNIALNRKIYGAHQIAWLLHYGTWPTKDIDHENLVKSDNRIVNLRLATDSQNHGNTRAPSTNTSGRKGVTLHKRTGKWQAAIRVNGKSKYLGLYSDLEAAHQAYVAAAKSEFGQFARTA